MDLELTPALATDALHAGGVSGRVVSAERLDGGVSNLTWHIKRADDSPVVLRLERPRGIFQPYDIAREARVIRSLEPSPIPVPQVLGEVGRDSPLGAPYVVLSWLDYPHMGMVPMTLRWWTTIARWLNRFTTWTGAHSDSISSILPRRAMRPH